MRGHRGTNRGLRRADVWNFSAMHQEAAVQVVRLAKVLQDVQTLAIARGSAQQGTKMGRA